jgi:hypothetical protein
MFIKVTICENDSEIFLNALKIDSMWRVSGYTTIRVGEKAIDVLETPEEISAQLAGGHHAPR